MKVHTEKLSTIIIVSLLAFVMTSTICSAQGYSRSGRSELFGMFQTVGGTDVKFDGVLGVPDDFGWELDSTTLYGAGIGFNATDHWNVNMDLLFGSMDGEFVIPGVVVPPHSTEADIFLWDLNVDYNILADRLTPLVTAGIGFANMDVDVTMPGVYSASASESNFSYNVGVGGRWDITDNILIKLVYRITWTEIEDSNDKQDFSGVALSVAYMF